MNPKDKIRRLSSDEWLGQNRESEYLGSEDIDDSVEPILTIAALWNGEVTLQRGKENKDVISFVEERVEGIGQVRPLIINSTNRKTLRKIYGDAKASTLEGKKIQLYIDHNVRDPQDGGKTDGIRIRPFKPKAKAPAPPCSDCGGEIKPAMGRSSDYLVAYTNKKFGRPLCADCATKRANAQETPDEHTEPEPENEEGANNATD